MLTLRGAPALSDHQTQKLFERVRAALAEGGVEIVAGSPVDAESVYRAEVAHGRERTRR